jgi:tetratricopeptide (TPR) repeat protein
MKCYNCGATLTQHDFCTACKSDVKQYKRILEAANRKYNEGLEKAQVRDLSGAEASLKQCLKLNKEHVDARNLLGLVYFEMGEVVAALAEWIISKNLQPEKNLAEDYIQRLQNNQSKLDTYNQAIHKYNKALDLCLQGSDDLAIIQLKKIVALNGKFVKAQLLLALIYMSKEEWDKAYPLLKKVTQVDRGNTQAQNYLREIAQHKNAQKKNRGKKDKDSVVRYERDNEVIIQPAQVIEPNTSKSTLVGFAVGFLLGAAILFFLVLPGRIESVRTELENTIRSANETKEAQSATIAALESQVESLTKEKDSVMAQYGDLYGENSNQEAVTALIGAVQAYLTDETNLEGIAAFMDVCIQNESFYLENSNVILDMYGSIKEVTYSGLAQYHYDKGYASYEAKDYQAALLDLELAVQYYSGNADSQYYLGATYQALDNKEKAKEVYNNIIENFPNSSRVNQAKRALSSMES